MAKSSFPRRGQVYLVRFDPAFGSEIRKTRPAVVISNNHMNELSPTVLVMPITSGHYPCYHLIALRVPEGGLSQPSSIVTDQIRSVDKRRFVRRTGVVSQGTITRIEQAIRDHCALPEGGVISE